MKLRSWCGLAAALGALALAGTAVGQQPYVVSDDASLLQRLETAEARIRELEGQLGDRQQPATVQDASYGSMMRRLDALEATVAAEEGDGWENTHSQKWSHKWGGRMMFDYINAANQSDGVDQFADYFEVRRLRFFAEGEGYGVYDYKLQIDFEPEGERVFDENGALSGFADATSIKDVYVGISDIPFLGRVQMGHFKQPFSLEELTSSKYITFMERSLPNVFATGRRLGMAAWNQSQDQRATWAIGVSADDFDDVTLESSDSLALDPSDNIGSGIDTRATWLPVYDLSSEGRYLIHLGGNFRYVDDHDDMLQFRARPDIIHEGGRLIDTGAFASSDFTVAGMEAASVWGPFSVQSELMWLHANGNPVAGKTDGDIYGAYVYGSYFLTGENRAYKRSKGAFDRVKPLENFWLVRTGEGPSLGRGAWELTTRWSILDFTDMGAGQLNTITVGTNWYMNPYTRMMFNWQHAMPSSPTGNASDYDFIGMRLQLDF